MSDFKVSGVTKAGDGFLVWLTPSGNDCDTVGGFFSILFAVAVTGIMGTGLSWWFVLYWLAGCFLLGIFPLLTYLFIMGWLVSLFI